MTQEDKDLLLKDLCARLPYGVKLFKVNEPESAFELYSIDKESGEIRYYKYRGKSLEIGDMSRLFRINDIPRFKPYLRPMSSMTEKDCLSISKELNLSIRARGGDIYFPHNEDNTLENWNKVNNWLLKNHFDFMGLITKGLAIEVTEENNPYKK